jgi:hypothetical protein
MAKHSLFRDFVSLRCVAAGQDVSSIPTRLYAVSDLCQSRRKNLGQTGG